MSKGSKTRRSASRKALKSKQKAAKRALYASYAGTGRRSEKRVGRRRTPTVGRGSHLMNNCGNVGCNRCITFDKSPPPIAQEKPSPVKIWNWVRVGERLGHVVCTCRHDQTCIVQFEDDGKQTSWIDMGEVVLVPDEEARAIFKKREEDREKVP